MSKRDWIKYAAFGLVLAVLLAIVSNILIWKPYSDYKEENTGSREKAAQHDIASAHKRVEFRCATTGKAVTVCYIQTPETEGASKYTEYDLKAQQDMAEWALLMVLLSIFGLVVSSVGICLVATNLRQADRAIRSAESNARDQNRAYLNAASADLLWGKQDGSKASITIGVQNSGQTPAMNVIVTSKVFVEQEVVTTERRSFDKISFESPTIQTEIAVPGGGYVTPFIYASDSERKTLSDVYGDVATINIAGTISYETIFKEIVETQFWFSLGGTQVYRNTPVKRPKITGLPTNPRLSVSTYFNTPEEPQRLAVVPSDATAYKIIGKVK